jgi:hypothetical protein
MEQYVTTTTTTAAAAATGANSVIWVKVSRDRPR